MIEIDFPHSGSTHPHTASHRDLATAARLNQEESRLPVRSAATNWHNLSPLRHRQLNANPSTTPA